jgi:hypothetical protein
MSRLEFTPDPNQEDEEALESSLAGKAQEESALNRLAMPETGDADEGESHESTRRLEYIDQLLRNAPLLSVPMGFADRVVAAIKRRTGGEPDYRDATGIVLGLMMTALITIPLLGTPAYLIGRSIFSPSFRADLGDDLINFFENLTSWMTNISVNSTILLPIGVVVIIALVALSSYFIWFVKGLLNTDTSEEQS